MFNFESRNARTYLVYRFEQDDSIDSIALGMIINNNIDNFAPAVFSQIDNDRFIKYDITSKIQASQMFSGTVNKKLVLGLLNGITDAVINSFEYMINAKTLCIELDHIFVDISSGKATLICIPLENKEETDLLMFFKKLMFESRFDQNENCDYVAKILNYLNSTAKLSPVDFKEFLNFIGNIQSTGDTSQNVSSLPKVDKVQIASMTPENNISQQTPVNMQTSNVQSTANVYPASAYITPQQMGQPLLNNIKTQPNVGNMAQTNITQNNTPNSMAMPVNDKKIKKKNIQSNEIKMPQNTNNEAVTTQGTENKKMTMFYLLSHYSKENAAIYKAQKNQGVQVNGEQQPQIPVMNNTVPTPVSKSMPPTNVGFAIPGVSTPINPSQSAPQAVQVKPANNTVPAMPNSMSNTYNNNGMQMQNNNVAQPQFMNNNLQPVPSQIQPNVIPVKQNNPPIQSQNMGISNFGETTVLGGGNDGETTVLGDLDSAAAPPIKQPFIIRMSNNEKIAVNKPVYRIGKERSYVDYFIGDNSYVSRGHANIISRDGKYYIVDNNSRNHTFVNGEVITSSTEVELKNGDTFKLANEAFEFKLF